MSLINTALLLMHIPGKRGRFGICWGGGGEQLKTSPSLLGTIRAHHLSRHTCDAQQTSPAFPQAHIILLLSLSCLGVLGLLAHCEVGGIASLAFNYYLCSQAFVLPTRNQPSSFYFSDSLIIGLHMLTASDPLKQNLGARPSECPVPMSRHLKAC